MILQGRLRLCSPLLDNSTGATSLALVSSGPTSLVLVCSGVASLAFVPSGDSFGAASLALVSSGESYRSDFASIRLLR